jgi:phospholipid/cholesterol/gamma-HCH transport system substrate-binding protein
MPRSLRWRNLIPGLLSLAAVAGMVAAILSYARIGALRGDSYRLYAFTNEARGILENSDVWLVGQRVGVVEGIEFRAVATDTAKRIRLTLKVLRRHQSLIRGDSYAQIRSGGRLLGEPVVYITMGTDRYPALEEEAVLDSREQADAENVASQIALASRDFPAIAQNAKRLLEHARELANQLDGVGTDEPGVALRVVGRRAQRLSNAANDTGSVGRFLADSVALGARVARIMARTDSLGARLAETGSRLRGLSGDSSMGREIADLRNEISIVRSLLTEARGSAGRLMFDQAIPRQLQRVERELGLLMEDLRRDPARYLIH